MPYPPIFDGNLDRGFTLGNLCATKNNDRYDKVWTVARLDTGESVGWFKLVCEAMRYMKAVDDGARNARAAQQFVSAALRDQKRRDDEQSQAG